MHAFDINFYLYDFFEPILFYLIFLSCRFILCSHIGNRIANTVGVVLVIIGLVMMIILNSLLLEFNFRTLLLSLVQSDGKKKSKKKLCPCIKWNRTREKEPLLQVYLLFFNIDVFYFSCHFQDSLSYVTSDINNDEVKEHKIKDEEVPDNDDQKGNGPDGNVFKRFQSKPVGKVM